MSKNIDTTTVAPEEAPFDPYNVEFDTPKNVEFVTKNGAPYELSGIVSIERAPTGGLVLFKTDGTYCSIEPGFEFLDVREL